MSLALLCQQVLQENEQLEEELVRVRGGNLRAAQILAAPLLQPESPDRGGGDGGHRPPAVATAPEGSPSVPPQTPPPPDTVPPKRPRPDDD